MPAKIDPSVLAAWRQIWKPELHRSPAQVARLTRAQNIPADSFDLRPNHTAVFQGSSGDQYAVSLADCDCADFARRQLPCKHIYRLALELGTVEIPDYDKKAAAGFNFQAEIDRFYELYRLGILTGEQYAKIGEALQK